MSKFKTVISYKDRKPIEGGNEVYIGHSLSPDIETAVLSSLQVLGLLDEDRSKLDISCSVDE